jgi:hypothetical protein
MFKVTIQRPRELQTVGYYETLTEAERVVQTIRANQSHNFEVKVNEENGSDSPAMAKRDGLGLWL